jgi:hypothetical protein
MFWDKSLADLCETLWTSSMPPKERAGSPSHRAPAKKKKTGKTPRKKKKTARGTHYIPDEPPNFTPTHQISIVKDTAECIFGVAMNSNPQSGVVVTGLTPGGLVERSGVLVGDIVYAVNGMRVAYAIETTEVLKSATPGTIMLDIVRGALPLEEASVILVPVDEADGVGEDHADEPAASVAETKAAEEGADPQPTEAVSTAAAPPPDSAAIDVSEAEKPAEPAASAEAAASADAAADSVAALTVEDTATEANEATPATEQAAPDAEVPTEPAAEAASEEPGADPDIDADEALRSAPAEA